MTSSASTPPQPRKSAVRASAWRQLAAFYLDILICSFIAWVVCFSFGWQGNWTSLALFLWFGEFFWCRDRLRPTAGEFCLGIRYLTSSSSQVVADIQVVHAKLKLNGFLLTAGVVELTLAFAFLAGWTFLEKAAFWSFTLQAPYALFYWVPMGLAFFLCGAHILSGAKNARWVVSGVHAILATELFRSFPVWEGFFRTTPAYTPWLSLGLVNLVKSQVLYFPGLFLLWSLFVAASLFFSSRHLVN